MRRCNGCVGAYKFRAKVIHSEKKASQDGKTSATQDLWKGWTEEQQAQWYRQQKRSDDKRGFKRDGGHLRVKSAESHSSRFGKRRFNELLPYSVYHDRQAATGKPLKEIMESWKEMLLDPRVDREEILLKGEKVTCLEVFGGIHKYVDDEIEHKVSKLLEEDVVDQVRLDTLVHEHDEQLEKFRDAHQLGSAGLTAKGVVRELADFNVAAHLLPEPSPAQAIPQPSDLAGAFTGSLLHNLAEVKDAQDESEAKLTKDAEASGQGSTTTTLICNYSHRFPQVSTGFSQTGFHRFPQDSTGFPQTGFHRFP